MTRHRGATDSEIWTLGVGVGLKTDKVLYGRADLGTDVCLSRQHPYPEILIMPTYSVGPPTSLLRKQSLSSWQPLPSTWRPPTNSEHDEARNRQALKFSSCRIMRHGSESNTAIFAIQLVLANEALVVIKCHAFAMNQELDAFLNLSVVFRRRSKSVQHLLVSSNICMHHRIPHGPGDDERLLHLLFGQTRPEFLE